MQKDATHVHKAHTKGIPTLKTNIRAIKHFKHFGKR